MLLEGYDGIITKPDLDELYHHGILGMHWGQRNGPPYPLGSDKSTGKRLKSTSGRIQKNKKKLAKASAKAARANKKAAQAGNDFLHPIKAANKDALQTKAFRKQAKVDKLTKKIEKDELKEQKLQNEQEFNEKLRAINPYTEAIPGLTEWILKNDPDLKKIDPNNPEKTAQAYRDDMRKQDEDNELSPVDKKVKEVANSNQDMFNDILDRTNGMRNTTPDEKKAWEDFRDEISRVAKENGIYPSDLQDKIYESYEKRSAEIAKMDSERQAQKVKDVVENTKIEKTVTPNQFYGKGSEVKEWVDYSGNFKSGDSKINISTESGTEEDLKKWAESILTNKSSIIESCREAMKEDGTHSWAPDGVSEKEFYDGLDLKTARIFKYPNGTSTVQLSFWEKDDSYDLLGGHEVDMDIALDDLDNRKRKVMYVSVNG